MGTLQLEGTYNFARPGILNGSGYQDSGAIHVVNPAGGGTSSITLTGSSVISTTTSVNIDPNATLRDFRCHLRRARVATAWPGKDRRWHINPRQHITANLRCNGVAWRNNDNTVRQGTRSHGVKSGGTSVTSGAVSEPGERSDD